MRVAVRMGMCVAVVMTVVIMVVIVLSFVLVSARFLAFGTVRVVVFMAVMPQLRLVEQKEEHQPHQQNREQLVRVGMAFLERFGQQVHEGRGEQGPCRQTQQMLRPHAISIAQTKAHQQCGDPDTPNASGQCGDQNCY